MSFGVSLDALAAGATDDEETTAASGPDETVRAGVMERLIRVSGPFPDAAVDFSILSAHTSLQTFS